MMSPSISASPRANARTRSRRVTMPTSSPSWTTGRRLRPRSAMTAAAEDAERAREPALDHEAGGCARRAPAVDRDGGRGHRLAGRARPVLLGVDVLGEEPAEQAVRLAEVTALLGEQVPLGDDAEQLAVLDHRDARDVAIDEQRSHRLERRL